ncbi:hypothetical protein FH972_021399 [Carpinus fangiana]|uniref:Uncharacterized protein n=1 Tax=Carpinus fangiana TaxID=176857 RepID=A0A5N6KPV1_9ROSI|nr:hypothetical protein FH972_021399 [Carpinus fangiana]
MYYMQQTRLFVKPVSLTIDIISAESAAGGVFDVVGRASVDRVHFLHNYLVTVTNDVRIRLKAPARMPKFSQLLGPPILLSLALPLALFATVTTTIAVSALLFRASIVYFELGAAVVQSWLLPGTSASSFKQSDPTVNDPASSQSRRRSRGSAGSTPGNRTPLRTDSFAALSGSGANRDFEGVGGWRLTEDAHDDETWIGINSRLELPAAGGFSLPPHRRHRRTLSSQSHVFAVTPEAFKMSPVDSRARTPQAYDIGHGLTEYFGSKPVHGGEGETAEDVIPMSPEETIAKVRMDERRRSVSAASNVSSGSSGRNTISLKSSH